MQADQNFLILCSFFHYSCSGGQVGIRKKRWPRGLQRYLPCEAKALEARLELHDRERHLDVRVRADFELQECAAGNDDLTADCMGGQRGFRSGKQAWEW